MDPLIPKNTSYLPETGKGSDGNLRQDLLFPALPIYRETYKEGGHVDDERGVEAYKTRFVMQNEEMERSGQVKRYAASLTESHEKE